MLHLSPCGSSLSVERGLGHVPIRLWIELAEPEGPSNHSPTVSPFQMNHQVKGIADIGADCLVGQFDARLQDATCETRKGLVGRVRMNCGERAGMAGV